MGKYNVAFRLTEKNDGLCGVITWCSFPDEEAFNKEYNAEMRESKEVVEAGVSEERCVELALSTPAECQAAACLEKSRNKEGHIDDFLVFACLEFTKFAVEAGHEYSQNKESASTNQ